MVEHSFNGNCVDLFSFQVISFTFLEIKRSIFYQEGRVIIGPVEFSSKFGCWLLKLFLTITLVDHENT